MHHPSVLIADREPRTQALASQALAGLECRIESAAAVEEMLRRVSDGQVEVLILDEQFEHGGDLALLGRIKASAPELPVILTSARGSVQGAVAAMQAGAADYLLKPMSGDVLAAALRRVGALNGHAGRESVPGRTARQPADSGKRLLTRDPAVGEVLRLAGEIAASRATVLILGESGTGKELLAAYIHSHGGAAGRPFVAMNCAALPETLAESELFGHEKGTFTGAMRTKIGKFEAAHGGTLLLDEISELPLPLQAKLLRALQEREIDRVGGIRPIPVDVRIIAISNLDLRQAVSNGRFRQDLFYRINVIPLVLPPLRQRRGDIDLLAEHFLQRFAARNGKSMTRIAPDAMAALLRHTWPGNVRELENAIERAVLVGSGDTLQARHLALEADSAPAPAAAAAAPRFATGLSVHEMERQLITQTLRDVNNNRTQAAELLGISIRTLRNKLKEYTHSGGAAPMGEE
jgi:DNA-binding NtrC family response regulator